MASVWTPFLVTVLPKDIYIWLKHSDTEKLFCVPNLLDSLLKWRMMLTTDMQHRYLSFCNFILLLILICLPWIHDPYNVLVQDFKPLIPIKHSDYCFFYLFIFIINSYAFILSCMSSWFFHSKFDFLFLCWWFLNLLTANCWLTKLSMNFANML